MEDDFLFVSSTMLFRGKDAATDKLLPKTVRPIGKCTTEVPFHKEIAAIKLVTHIP